MLHNLKSFEVRGLFRRVDHEIVFNRDPSVTIITGPNGVGKTHLLRLLKSMLAFELSDCMSMQFDVATITYENDRKLRFTRIQAEDDVSLKIQVLSGANKSVSTVKVDQEAISGDESEGALPGWIIKLSDNSYYDTRVERTVSRRYIEARLGRRLSNFKDSITSQNKVLASILENVSPILIDTKRLDIQSLATRGDQRGTNRPAGVISPVKQYIEQVRAQVNVARNESLTQSQQADRKFAARALDTNLPALTEVQVRDKYERLSGLHGELYKNGLAAQSIDVSLPETSKLSRAERRILTVFLEDWEEKLAPLLPVNTKLNSAPQNCKSKVH